MNPGRRRWYHCSQVYREQWTAERRAPIVRSDSEPETPRLCVSATLAQALAAVWWSSDVHVYWTAERRTVPPSGVFDQVLTGERWVVPPVELTHIGRINYRWIEEVQDGLSPLGHRYEYAADWCSRFFRLHRFALLVEELYPHLTSKWVKRYAANSIGLFAGKLPPGHRLSDLARSVTLTA